MTDFRVDLTREALEDLERLESFLIDVAIEHGDHDLPGRAIDAIRQAFRILETNPYTCRKVGGDPMERELVIPFGDSGYVALFEIVSPDQVAIGAIRHQREDDYH